MRVALPDMHNRFKQASGLGEANLVAGLNFAWQRLDSTHLSAKAMAGQLSETDHAYPGILGNTNFSGSKPVSLFASIAQENQT